MQDMALGWEVLGHKPPDRVPGHAHGSRDASQTFTRGMPPLDLLPAQSWRPTGCGLPASADSRGAQGRLALAAQPP